MASVDWTEQAMDSLARLDGWRVSQGWQPIGVELMVSIESYFRRWDPSKPPGFVPGRKVELEEGPTDLRMATVTVRSKRFKVYFRYLATKGLFEVLRVLHPRAQ